MEKEIEYERILLGFLLMLPLLYWSNSYTETSDPNLLIIVSWISFIYGIFIILDISAKIWKKYYIKNG